MIYRNHREPEIIAVSFTAQSLNTTPDCEDNPATLLDMGAFVFDEHGCEIGWFSITSDFSVPSTKHSLGPSAEHPDRDVFGWPEGIELPVSLYNNVDEGWACPSVEAACAAVLYEAAERAAPDYHEGMSWWAHAGECDILAPGTVADHGPNGYGRVVVIDHNPATNAVQVKNPDDTGRFAPVWLVAAKDLYEVPA